MKVRWFIDAGPLTPLAAVIGEGADWPAATLHISGEVHAEATASPSTTPTPRQAFLARQTEGQPWIEVHRVALGSPAAVYWSTRMQPMLGKKFDAGEAETIAICAGQPDSVFVTQDVVAAFVALSELGPGRVALPYDLWCWLLDEGLIDRDQFDALCRKTHDNLKQRLPGVPQRLTGTP